MRNTFIQELVRQAEADPTLFLLTADLGFSVLEPFRDRFPDRYLNVGVAEQNMVGIAAGLALSGKRVFTYSIANFAITRCLEQIRNDVCYHHLDVTVVAVGGGLAYGSQGYTHHGMEDVAFARVLPGMTVVVPADAAEVRWAMPRMSVLGGPAYLRLARGGEPPVHPASIEDADLGGLIALRPAGRINVVGCGPVLAEAVEASKSLAEAGVSLGVFSCPVVGTASAEALRTLAGSSDRLLVLEEHLGHGGLYGVVAETVAAMSGPRAQIQALGLSHDHLHVNGTQVYLRDIHGIGASHIVRHVTSTHQA